MPKCPKDTSALVGTSAEVPGHFGHADVSWVRTLVGPKCVGSQVSWVRSVCTPGPHCKSKTGRENQDRLRLSTNHRRSSRDRSRRVLDYKTSTVCVILEAEPVPLVRPHPVRLLLQHTLLWPACIGISCRHGAIHTFLYLLLVVTAINNNKEY